MFRVRVFTPAAVDQDGLSQAGAELVVGPERIRFIVELRYWSIADYEQQWRTGIARMLHGASSTALMTAYRGTGGDAHLMWALWRHQGDVHVQQLSVLPAELESPFDPAQPWEHVGEWIPATEHELPIPEWRVDVVHLYAAALGIRWPLYP